MYSKIEKEKKCVKKWEEKKKKMEVCKLEKEENGIIGIEFVYVDYMGNLVDILLDFFKKVKVEVENIVIGVFKMIDEDWEVFDFVWKGIVLFFDYFKGFGFIVDNEN